MTSPKNKPSRPRPQTIAEIPLLAVPDLDESESKIPNYVGVGRAEEVPPAGPIVDPGDLTAVVKVKEVLLEARNIEGPSGPPDVRRDSSAAAAVAESFLDLVNSGKSPDDAALTSTGMTYNVLKTRRDVLAAAQNLMDTFHIEPGARKKVRESAVNRVLLENTGNPDSTAQKLVLEASKQIAADQGISDRKTLVGVNVNLSDLQPFLQPPTQEHE